MSDYISREDALLCATGEYADDSFEDSIREAECKKIAKRLKELKPAKVRENVHGKWIYSRYYVWICSECGGNPNIGTGYTPSDEQMKTQWKFCNLCGADMRDDNVVSEKEERNRDVIIDIVRDR